MSRTPTRATPRKSAITAAISAAVTIAAAVLAGPSRAEESYINRPVYSEPATGLQLPPGCEVDPSWRSPVAGSDLEVWVARCAGGPRVWLLRRQVVEIVNARQSRLRFQVLDERVYPDEVAGETLSVQCTGPRDESGYVVRGARWREGGRELRLKSARGVLRVDLNAQTLADSEVGAVDCARFPDREAMMKKLQQAHN